MGISTETLKKILEQKSLEMNELKYKYKLLEDKYNKLLEKTKHNARGAGRKSKFSQSEIDEMILLKEQGKSTRKIAEIYNCSHVTVNKLINEQEKR